MRRAMIFEKIRLNPAQARTVADRRFEDAAVLLRTGKNAHANGAIYLAGIAVECLLKAILLEKHSWLQTVVSLGRRSKEEVEIWELCYRSHDLEKLQIYLSNEIRTKMAPVERRMHGRSTSMLKSVCHWTIFVRYSTKQADINDAEIFLDRVRELRRCLK